MQTTNRGRHGAACALLSLLLGACGSDANPNTRDPADPSPPLAVKEKKLPGSNKARAADYGGGHASVAIRGKSGELLFGTEYTPQDDTHVLVTNKVNLGAMAHNDAGVLQESYSLELAETDKVSLDDAVAGATIIQGFYENAAKDYYATQDTTGCTLGPIGTAASCTTKGACCDQHDACYLMYHCTSDSWTNSKASAACKQCNSQVLACVNPFSGKWPGKATCCATDSSGKGCGAESPPWKPETPIPTFPNKDTKTGLDPSLAIPMSPVRTIAEVETDGGVELADDAGISASEEEAESEDDAGPADETPDEDEDNPDAGEDDPGENSDNDDGDSNNGDSEDGDTGGDGDSDGDGDGDTDGDGDGDSDDGDGDSDGDGESDDGDSDDGDGESSDGDDGDSDDGDSDDGDSDDGNDGDSDDGDSDSDDGDDGDSDSDSGDGDSDDDGA